VTRFRWTAIKLLIFTIVTILTTTYLAAIIGNLRLLEQPYEVRAEFSDATGLLNGDVVKAAGVTVGRVEGIEIQDGMAIVTMTIDEGVELPSNLSAEIRFRNLIGQRMITLTRDEDVVSDGLLADGNLIPIDRTDAAFDLSELFNGLRPLIRSTDPSDINLVARELTVALRGRDDEVAAIFGNLADVSDVLATRDQELSTLLDSLNVLTADLAGRDAQLRSTLANLNTFLAEISASRSDLEAALTNLDEAAARLDRFVTANDELIISEVRDLSVILDAVNDKRSDLRSVVDALPAFTLAVERTFQYGEWGNQHLVTVCKDDFGLCGRRGSP
jgi:phospholipid/cholesterol/gamma-HCH transport system substrate-binding protein